MSTNAPAGFESRERPTVPTENERVTARIDREDDGTIHHEYRAGGRAFGSLEALNAALEGPR